MHKVLLISKVQWLGMFGLNRLLHTEDPKERRNALWMAIGFLISMLAILGYCTMYAIACVQMGIVDALPGVMLMTVSLATLLLTMLKSSGALFGQRDYDLVMSMPISNAAFIASRLIPVYGTNLLIGALVLAPSLVIYALTVHATLQIVLMLVLALIFAPLLPMIAAMALGALITAASTRFRHMNVVAIILSMGATLMIVAFSGSLQSTEQLESLGKAMGELAGRYPLAGLLNGALAQADWARFGWFLLASGLPAVLFVALLARFYQRIHAALFAKVARSDYRVGALKRSTPFAALYRRELRRYISCTIYALNSGIGAVMLVAVSIALIFSDLTALEAQLGAEGLFKTLAPALPFALSLFVTLSSTTAASLSLEGKGRWLICSIPVPTRTILGAKIAVNLTILWPASLLGGIVCAVKTQAGLPEAIMLVLMPILYSAFIAVLGMAANIKHPKYDWTNEYQVVKNGASMLITMFTGMISAAVPMILCLSFPQIGSLVEVVAALAVGALTIWIYRSMASVKLHM